MLMNQFQKNKMNWMIYITIFPDHFIIIIIISMIVRLAEPTQILVRPMYVDAPDDKIL